MTANLSSSAKREWLVILRDLPDAGEKRAEAAKDHLETMRPLRGSYWVLGGALLDEGKLVERGEKSIGGNVLIAQAETREAVLEELGRDAYARKGVWDMSGVQILAYESVFRKDLGV